MARIVIAGAGSIGCYVGGCLALAGSDVRLLARDNVAARLRSHGLRLTDAPDLDRQIDVSASGDASAALADADLVLVSVKSGATSEMAATIARHAPADAVVVSLQNGVRNADELRAQLGPRRVLAGMVPFNVVQSIDGSGALHVHRATRGTILIERSDADVAARLDVPHLPVRVHPDIAGVQWGKLLFNLNNALNALSGLPLARQLADRRWRLLLAGQMREALACLAAAGIRPVGTERVPSAFVPAILGLPDWLFTRIARRMLAIDPAARSSMWEDLERRRLTEIDVLQGEILALARRTGVPAPLTAAVHAAAKAAEARNQGSPRLVPEAVRSGAGLA